MSQILVVDDEQEILDSTGDLLRECGFDVAVVQRAEEVVPAMQREEPGLVLHDYRMPGLDLARQIADIRSRPEFAHVRVVVFTASLVSLREAQRIGADACIEKPFDLETLLRVCRQALG